MEKYLLDPKAPGAFSSDVMHKVVLNGIDFELSENIWDAIDDAFGNYWNIEVGYGGWTDLNSAVSSISNWLQNEHIIFPIDKIVTIVNIMFDWIEQVPGAILDDDVVVIPHIYILYMWFVLHPLVILLLGITVLYHLELRYQT